MANDTISSPSFSPGDFNLASMPTDPAGLWTFLLSFRALHDWLKLFLIGGALETVRRMFYYAWQTALEAFWITAHFDQDDESFGTPSEPWWRTVFVDPVFSSPPDWMMVWLSKHPAWHQAREVQISTRNYIKGPRDDGEIAVEGEEHALSSFTARKRKLAYLPAFGRQYDSTYLFPALILQYRKLTHHSIPRSLDAGYSQPALPR